MVDSKALNNIGYGLYVITSNDGNKHNGMIANSVIQATSEPCQVLVVLNKSGYSAQTIFKTKKLNVCPLTEDVPFDVIKNFGFSSGRDVNKFDDFSYKTSKNGLAYLTQNCNSFLSLEVVNVQDLGTHYLFTCVLTEAEIISQQPSVTYAYYHKNIKPQPVASAQKKWVCKLCGYVYDGEELPEDFSCPWCGADISFFEQR